MRETGSRGCSWYYVSRTYYALGTWLGPILMLFNLNPTTT